MDKNTIRKSIRMQRQKLPAGFVDEKSAIIANNLFSIEAVRKADLVLAYVELPGEVSTREIIRKLSRMSKKITLPVCIPDTLALKLSLYSSEANLKPGHYGVMIPSEQEDTSVSFGEIDIVLVPGVAFDRLGNRIGYGKGYYDRFLAELTPSQIKIGLCFDFQLLDQLPVDCFDVRMDFIITESCIFQLNT